MLDTLREALDKLRRDRSLPRRVLIEKAVRYARELALAPLYLRQVDDLGRGVRTLGRPRIENHGFLAIGDGTLLRSVNVPVELVVGPGAELRIGRDVRLNYGVSIGCTGRVVLGDGVRVGTYATIMDNDYHDAYDRSLRPAPQPVHIEDDVWIGAKVVVMPGVRIGRASIVAAGAVVVHDVAPFTVVGGVPAKEMRKLDPERFVSNRGGDE